MKKTIGIILAFIVIGLALVKYSIKTENPIITTEMCILTDYLEPRLVDSTAILEEALKAITVECNHIFLNKALWGICISDLDKEAFKTIWNVYDTHIGLLYIQHKNATTLPGMQMNQLSIIKDPFDQTETDTIEDNKNWPTLFETLFDIHIWQQYHNSPFHKICIYMNGHGMPRASSNHESELVCGVNAKQFAHLLDFFNTQLRINLLGVQSCYWTTQRIHELMEELYGYKTLHFSILTPMSAEKTLWLDTAYNYMQSEGKQSCFFECCADFTEQYTNQVTDEIKAIVYNADTLKLNQNQGQKATLIAAGSNELITIQRV